MRQGKKKDFELNVGKHFQNLTSSNNSFGLFLSFPDASVLLHF
jgi:hypothetical protein